MSSNKTEVKILGQMRVKRYDVGWRCEEYYETYDVVDYPIIWEGMLEHPPFEEGQYIYINEIEKEVRIIKITRSNHNKYVYYTDHRVGDLTEDSDTKKSLEKALSTIEINKTERINREQEDKQVELENKKSKFRKILDIIKS